MAFAPQTRLNAVLAAGQRHRVATTGVPLRDMPTDKLKALNAQLRAEQKELYKKQRQELNSRPGASPEHRKYHELFVAEDKAFFELRDAYRARYGDAAPLVDPYGNFPDPADLPEDLAAMLAKFYELNAQKLKQRNVLIAKFGENRWRYEPPSRGIIHANLLKMLEIDNILHGRLS